MTIAGRGANSLARVIAVAGHPITLDQDKCSDPSILPGKLVNYDSNGNLINNTTTSKVVARMFALERDELNKDIDTAYVTNDQVKVGLFGVGSLVLAWIPSGQNLLKGALLGPDGSGRLIANSTAGQSIAVCMDSGPGAVLVDTRLLVQII